MIITVGLTEGVVHLHACQDVPGSEQFHSLAPQGFVATTEGLGLPVSPVDVVLKQCETHHTVSVWVQY